MFKTNYRLNLIAFIAIVFFMTAIEPGFSADKKKGAKATKEYTIFPDEYSELDGIPVPSTTKDENILRTLEKEWLL